VVCWCKIASKFWWHSSGRRGGCEIIASVHRTRVILMTSFAEDVCLPALVQAQNEDGGWGYRAAFASRVEPTCWALLGMAGHVDWERAGKALERGYQWLRSSQLPDGSWPAVAGQQEGSWTTALACLALRRLETATAEMDKGLAWICQEWPREGGWWWRILRWLRREENVSRQNDSYRGWNWTSRTSSWVEPTAYALIALDSTPASQRLKLAVRRRQLGEAMLYDRMCPGGGWNAGNPTVYGVPGDPNVVPTVWALLALRHNRSRPENQQSVDWLEQHGIRTNGPGSLALAHLCLEVYGRSASPLEAALQEFYRRNQFLLNVQVLAWAALALSPRPGWLHTAEEVVK